MATEKGRPVGELYDEHGRDLHRFAEGQARDPADADDVVQETLGVALTKGAPPGREGPWLFRVARNKLRKLVDRTRRRRETALSVEPASAVAAPLEALGRSEEKARVLEAVTALEADSREVLRLFYEEGLSHRAIAERLGVPATTVQSRLRAALLLLHRSLMGAP
jgi:RNA polymerase sigma-70 factor (ECF subfamily)